MDIQFTLAPNNLNKAVQMVNSLITASSDSICTQCRAGKFSIHHGYEMFGDDPRETFSAQIFCATLLKTFALYKYHTGDKNVTYYESYVACSEFDDKTKPSKIDQLTEMVESTLK